MSTPATGPGRVRAYLQFLASVCYFFLARSLAARGAQGLASPRWVPLIEQAMLVFLLLIGYGAMGWWMDRQSRPVSAQGLARRAGWLGEVGLGVSAGWAIGVICVLPLIISGGIAIVLALRPSAWGWLLADAAFFALMALAEEIAFRGYGFQRFALSVGSLGAVLGYAYLRTRALWVSWGINFGWKASRALIFGLAVSGISNHSPVVQGDPMGSFWLTGGEFGLDGTWITFFVLLAAIPVLYRLTRDLDFRYNAPVIVPGGIAVDLDAAGRAQHEAALRSAEPAGPGLVQILPAASVPADVAGAPGALTQDDSD
jgi:membrane protease YdiL (CAAX protease family)